MPYDLQESTSTLVKKVSQLFVRLANVYLKEFGIPHAYTLFLMQLWDEDGQTQAVLHKKIGIEQPTAVRTLDRMERDNFIKRVRSTEDRREIKIFLTERAKKIQGSALSCAKDLNELMLDGVTKSDKKTLNEYLRTMVTNLEGSLAKHE